MYCYLSSFIQLHFGAKSVGLNGFPKNYTSLISCCRAFCHLSLGSSQVAPPYLQGAPFCHKDTAMQGAPCYHDDTYIQRAPCCYDDKRVRHCAAAYACHHHNWQLDDSSVFTPLLTVHWARSGSTLGCHAFNVLAETGQCPQCIWTLDTGEKERQQCVPETSLRRWVDALSLGKH